MDEQIILNKIREINIENHIWIIYIIIIFMSWYANSLEKEYFINNDYESKEKYREIIIIIFSILIIIYTYFLNNSLRNVKDLNKFDNDKKIKLTELSAIASLLIVISGLIYLYIAYNDTNIDVELAFN